MYTFSRFYVYAFYTAKGLITKSFRAGVLIFLMNGLHWLNFVEEGAAADVSLGEL